MNISRNSHMGAYLETLSMKMGLKAHLTQEGTTAIFAFKNTPIAIIALEEKELSEDDLYIMKENVKALKQALYSEGDSKRELVGSLITDSNPFNVSVEFFTNVCDEARSKFNESLTAAQSITLDKPRPKKVALRVTVGKPVQRPCRPKELEEYLVA